LTTMLYMPPERRTLFGVSPNTIRLSAGIEKTEILLEDLKQALDKIEIKSELKVKINAVQKPSKEKEDNYANVRI
ncbi:MAG: PLP-dependent transferase, partial [Sedimentisphaerales bacterium]|nr:PLP-dependent transferase [Sedimentisphaerales bacterium]